MAVVFSTGDGKVDFAIAEVVEAVSRALPGRALGFYLHGSTYTGGRTPSSDVDILGLGDAQTSRDNNADAQTIAHAVTERHSIEIDLKVFAAVEFADDPWIDLRNGAALIAGVDWRDELGDPSFDARAREAVLHACLIANDGHDRVSVKAAHWLASCLLAVRYSVAAPSREAALKELAVREPELALALGTADEPDLPQVVTSRLITTVTRELRADVASPTPSLGPRCHALIRDQLAR